MNPDFVNLPPWLQTGLSLLGAAAVLGPIIVRIVGVEDSPIGKFVTTVGSDIAGHLQRKP